MPKKPQQDQVSQVPKKQRGGGIHETQALAEELLATRASGRVKYLLLQG